MKIKRSRLYVRDLATALAKGGGIYGERAESLVDKLAPDPSGVNYILQNRLRGWHRVLDRLLALELIHLYQAPAGTVRQPGNRQRLSRNERARRRASLRREKEIRLALKDIRRIWKKLKDAEQFHAALACFELGQRIERIQVLPFDSYALEGISRSKNAREQARPSSENRRRDEKLDQEVREIRDRSEMSERSALRAIADKGTYGITAEALKKRLVLHRTRKRAAAHYRIALREEVLHKAVPSADDWTARALRD